ncbi:hypothetical protein BG011_008438 [Mortierella polycephala]|uniref:XPA C-terminal domain-containing protein n=1 Tax=Mortierella polycephala TaxID=41804 RepID=A0A9P6UB68_9FUNG|nr:hypothetical protein BG011_008438 [Mortierella polycephala]
MKLQGSSTDSKQASASTSASTLTSLPVSDPLPNQDTSSFSQQTLASHSKTKHESSSIPHEESVGRPVSKDELPPEIRKKIERNRLAALERLAKTKMRIESERAIAKEFGEEAISSTYTSLLLGSGSSESSAGNSESQPSTSVVIEKNSHLINKVMEAIEPLPKSGWTKFYDYDLSKMKDTRAGFIQELDESDAVGGGSPAAEDENNRKRKWQPTIAQPDPSIFLGAEGNYECQDCTSVDIDFQLLRHFHVPVCIGCRDVQPEKYSLLTKTECRQDYLLTDPELRDTELFPFWERPNPKKTTWNNMMLYMRYQVEEFAFKKWGGPEGLDREFERRERDKEARKELKFKKELRDLRNKTRTSVWQDKRLQQRAKVHKHHFGTALVDPESGTSVQTCVECGIQVECEEF